MINSNRLLLFFIDILCFFLYNGLINFGDLYMNEKFLKEQLALAKKELKQFVLFQKQLKRELRQSHSSVTKFKQSESTFLSASLNQFEDRITELKIRIKYSLFNETDGRIQQYINFYKRLNTAISQLKTLEKTQKLFKLKRKQVCTDKDNQDLTSYQQSINANQISKNKEKINKVIFNINYLKQKLKTIDFNA